MREMTAAIYSDNQDAQLDATTKFRKLLSKEKNPPIDAVIRANVVPRFVEFLSSQNSMIQFEAAWALTSMLISLGFHLVCRAVKGIGGCMVHCESRRGPVCCRGVSGGPENTPWMLRAHTQDIQNGRGSWRGEGRKLCLFWLRTEPIILHS